MHGYVTRLCFTEKVDVEDLFQTRNNVFYIPFMAFV